MSPEERSPEPPTPSYEFNGYLVSPPSLIGLRLVREKLGYTQVYARSKDRRVPGSEIGYAEESEVIAPSLRLRLVRVEAPNPDAIRSLAPATMTSPVLVLPDAMFWNRRIDIVALITAARAPTLYPEREYADVGGLVAYGPNVPDNFRRAAGYVDRILKGASPGELPVQQPAKFELVVNLKAARSLGLDLSPALLARADEVIE